MCECVSVRVCVRVCVSACVSVCVWEAKLLNVFYVLYFEVHLNSYNMLLFNISI